MAKPSVNLPTNATDTNYTSGSDVGTPTKVEPSSGVKAQGVITPGVGIPSQWVQWFLYAVGVWLAYFNTWISVGEEIVYPITKSRSKFVSLMNGKSLASYTDFGGTGFVTAITDPSLLWVPDFSVVAGAGPSGEDLIGMTGGIRTSTQSLYYERGIDDALVSGLVLNAASVRLKPGVAEATVAERMHSGLFKRAIGTGTVTAIGTGGDSDNTTNEQYAAITISPSETIDLATYTYHVWVQSSRNAGSGIDRAFALSLSFTDPGPRNF